MLHTAIKQLLRWTPENVQEYTKSLMEHAINDIRESGYIIENEEYRGHHLFGIRMPKQLSLDKLKKSFTKHRVSVSYRGDSVRVSPNVYNDEIDIRKLLNALKEAIFASK